MALTDRQVRNLQKYADRQQRVMSHDFEKHVLISYKKRGLRLMRRDISRAHRLSVKQEHLRTHYLLKNAHADHNYKIGVGSIFTLAFMLLLAISVFRILLNGEAIQLSTLLSQVAGAPTIPTNWIGLLSTNFGSTFPWGLQWLGSIFDFFTDLFSFSLFASTAAVNVVIFFFYFLRWLFF